MYYLFDINGNELSFQDLQNKGPWCMHGAKKEEVFVGKYGAQFNLIINPEKRINIYAPDLFNIKTKKRGDLKTVNTPFFQAKGRFNKNPQYTVTFNVKDKLRYEKKYPDIEIYFWVKWEAVKFVGGNGEVITVQPMEGLWYIEFKRLLPILKQEDRHAYKQRVKDRAGNAKESYVIDLSNPDFKRLL